MIRRILSAFGLSGRNESAVKVKNLPHEKIDTENPNLYCTTHETLETEKGEAALNKLFATCKKNPGHVNFFPANKISISSLPEECRDGEVLEFVQATAVLTVRVAVQATSKDRPKYWPGSRVPYPSYDIREKKVMRFGTGRVRTLERKTDKFYGPCTCQRCKSSKTPRAVWWTITVCTAAQVVYDFHEARGANCRLFYDSADSAYVTLDSDGSVSGVEVENDWCEFMCVTCDEGVGQRLGQALHTWQDLHAKVTERCKVSRNCFTVSHPHGCAKMVSFGHTESPRVVGNSRDCTKYRYDTSTCPGCSGAYVFVALGIVSEGMDHLHSGVISGVGISTAGSDLRWMM